ncbi:RagB/SusD family nutrient uptake outer membrane protein [Segetibacter sp. 3557_3]|uniref:RagB/SusD family nutrient uptake outer membrane protein n=1 Tax=Segetibacter sp. 3557_3 TaxID=2547429 RepID=UPI001058405F|nr:RagB/SusD family nutrient uptake outer membrane protein [Segetibacter sp. 3557_3]TDH19989.1 RagB/SusD family nutrient uptake outer membrane protein [Segetibacter sp. 3557_3]
MKQIISKLGSLVVAALVLTSCHKLDVEVTTELTPETYPKTEAQYNSVMGPVYIALRGDYPVGYNFLQSMSSDESLLAIFGADWIDGNRYLELHRHTWTKDHPSVGGGWSALSNMIGLCNQTIFIINQSPEGATKNTSLAELKTMRAFTYFQMLDLFGNVPLDTSYGSTELKTNATRTQVFSFIESELKAAMPFLKTATGAATYGKPTRYMAHALLAKLYINAEVYTGSPRYNECIAACDSVMNAGNGAQYVLEPRSSYLQMFYPTNGPATKEFIFAIPYDPATSNGYMFYARYDLNRNLGIKYRYSGSTPGGNINPIINATTGNGLINNRPSGPRMTTNEFYAHFNDPNDIRNRQWLAGLQYWDDGSPIMVRTTNLGYNQFYTGNDPAGVFTYHLNLTPLAPSRLGNNSYDLGRDEIAWNTGYRNIKFYPDANSITRNQNNDVPVFRYSDIILMKAEAIFRGGTPTGGHTALSLINMLRAQRTTSPALTSLTLDDIYAERSRELAWENWHRNDMIRFGKFETSYGLGKTNSETYRRLYPIPTNAITANPNLKQNPGYQ